MKRITFILLLLVQQLFLAAQGVNYYKGDVYDALLKAKRENKALLVECYAGWNNRSRWMNQMINTDKDVLQFLSENFIVWKIDTETPGGAKFARDYKVTGYPSLFVFNKAGSVVDKIDKDMEPVDFIRTLEEDIFTLDGGNLWKLEKLEKAAQAGDRNKADAVFYEYLQKIGRDHLLNKSHRWVFADRTITFFGSSAYCFMVENRADLSSTPADSVEIDGYIFRAIYEEMTSMLLSSENCDSIRVNAVSSVAKELLPRNIILPLFPSAIKSYQASDYDAYLESLTRLMSAIPEEDGPKLAYTLSIVAQEGSTSQKARARSIVRRLMNNAKDPSTSSSLQVLYSNF